MADREEERNLIIPAYDSVLTWHLPVCFDRISIPQVFLGRRRSKRMMTKLRHEIYYTATT